MNLMGSRHVEFDCTLEVERDEDRHRTGNLILSVVYRTTDHVGDQRFQHPIPFENLYMDDVPKIIGSLIALAHMALSIRGMRIEKFFEKDHKKWVQITAQVEQVWVPFTIPVAALEAVYRLLRNPFWVQDPIDWHVHADAVNHMKAVNWVALYLRRREGVTPARHYISNLVLERTDVPGGVFWQDLTQRDDTEEEPRTS